MVKSRKSWSILSHPSLSFSLLVLHQSSISLIKRSRKPASTNNNHNEEQIDLLYNPATAIFLTELLKASISFTILLIQSSDHPQSSPSAPLGTLPLQRFSIRLRHSFLSALGPNHVHQIIEMFIPALLYTLQNHLSYISLAELDIPIYLITSQIKILTTAISSVVICERILKSQQWISLWMLALGVVIVQFESIAMKEQANQLRGIAALVLSSLASGLAGAWFERSLKVKLVNQSIAAAEDDQAPKDRKISHAFPNDPRRATDQGPNLWAKNLQLSIPSLIISYLMIYLEPHSRRHTTVHGFFYGFLPSPNSSESFFGQLGLVWLVILYHSIGGLLVSLIVKQSGSVVKNFATCFSIVLSVLVSSYSNHTRLGFNFYLGSLLVLLSIKTFTSFSN
ncbi:hypothetical protein PSTG_15258 [Puccinia striiformis f. sp. tritici PST-78]|uniref:Sugar phosphate transporter domain-containing protein n=1 Tax=Puccinia striiformis f. sp. tritici PST-78 TaxID=1165861 RepID=A0A0L0UW98_9BASI|nr:hypothetical protein PSTG_15258 [Puccinia striiformis f. sp. tritici PST-78]